MNFLYFILQFLLINSLEINIDKHSLVIFDYYTNSNQTNSLSFDNYKFRETTIFKSSYGKFPIMLHPNKYIVDLNNTNNIKYKIINNNVLLFKSNLKKTCFNDNNLEYIYFTLDYDTVINILFQLSAERYDTNSSIKISLLLNNLEIFSDIINSNYTQTNYYDQYFLKKGYHKLLIEGFSNGKWCSNPELKKGFQHGRYIAIHYDKKVKSNQNTTNRINLKKINYSVPYIISYIK